MPYLTTRKNLKLQLSPGLVTAYDSQPGNGVGLFWDTKDTHIHLLTYFPRTHTGKFTETLKHISFFAHSTSALKHHAFERF